MKRVNNFWMILVLCLASWQTAYSQAEDASLPQKSWSVGVNSAKVFSSLLKINDSLHNNPYIVDLGYSWNEQRVRIGMGGYNRSSRSQLEGFADNVLNTDWGLSFRLGYQKQYKLGSRWQADYGGDLVYRLLAKNTIEDSGFDVIKNINQSKGAGISTHLGISYIITAKLSVRSETSLQYTLLRTSSAKTFENIPEVVDTGIKTLSNQFFVFLPINIYLNFHF